MIDRVSRRVQASRRRRDSRLHGVDHPGPTRAAGASASAPLTALSHHLRSVCICLRGGDPFWTERERDGGRAVVAGRPRGPHARQNGGKNGRPGNAHEDGNDGDRLGEAATTTHPPNLLYAASLFVSNEGECLGEA
ncbi:hypothetical protein CALCODRAFT_325560 [Calocera cornea HHB12733]|uniref:Uncharacterized protein n=1 Tax=Calocera cornea HHB12733 TaxID=1353952 RepID=A0A165JFC9_9BASI|nr:hypothetical protein CALCODRAFT_325560 [Calocera cornea HHB12733]